MSKVEQIGDFFKADFGSERHGRNSFRLWVNKKLIGKLDVDGHNNIKFPIKDAKIVKTAKGNYVLVPEKDWNVFNVGRQCGYRGDSTFKVITELDSNSITLKYEIWNSPNGALGVSEYGLVSTNLPEIIVEEKATGRLYGAEPLKTIKYNLNGETELPNIDEELNELVD